MKRCIWCNLDDNHTTFDKEAHTIPQTLGGKDICENVCDECNSTFGNSTSKGPSVEAVIKETFYLSRLAFLSLQNEIGRNKALAKPNSKYFNVDLKNHKLTLKPSYQIKAHFQETLGRLIKRGLYKMFLEETDRQFGTGLQSQFDFIREYARYDLNDLPVFYFERRYGILLQSLEYAKTPKLYLHENERIKALYCNYGFYEFELFNHVFGLATSKMWNLNIDQYKTETMKKKQGLFVGLRPIHYLSDIDITLKILSK